MNELRMAPGQRWDLEVPDWCGDLMRAMHLLQQQHLLCDSAVTASDGSVLMAHAVVLAASSAYMAGMLQDVKTLSATLPGVLKLNYSCEAVEQLLFFVYTGKMRIENQPLMAEMARLAEELDIVSMVQWCSRVNVVKNGVEDNMHGKTERDSSGESDHDVDEEEGGVFVPNVEVKQEDELDNREEDAMQSDVQGDGEKKRKARGVYLRYRTRVDGAAAELSEGDRKKPKGPSTSRGRKKDLRKHTCKICNKSLSTKQSLGSHLRMHKGEKPFKCDECDKHFTQNSSLQAHIRCVHQDERPHQCAQCEQSFKRLRHLKRHEDTVHATKVESHSCHICGKLFTREDTLKAHEKAHTDQKVHKCEVCNKVFRQLSTLRDHALIHLGEATFACHICSGIYRTKRKLRFHQKIHDKNRERKFQCSYCAKQFFDKQSMNTHERSHTGERPYQCRYCEKAFYQTSTRREHELIHTGERRYVCEICGMDFLKISHLKRHKETHSVDRPYKCEECGKSFRQDRLLKTHLLIHTGERPKQCAICGKNFRTSGSLSTHNRSHMDVKPFACRFCDREFRKNQSRKTHEAKIHGQVNIPNSCTRDTAGQYVSSSTGGESTHSAGMAQATSFSVQELQAVGYSQNSNIIDRLVTHPLVNHANYIK